jgi:hypothetical protein
MAISIFLSHPQPINQPQKDFITHLTEWLSSRHFLPRTLGVTDYSNAVPLEAIRALMAESNGLISVAFRRTHIEKGTRTIRQGRNYVKHPVDDQWLTSPWSQIEPAMAYQIGLPILILRESGVIADGVLEAGIVGRYMPEFDLSIVEGEENGGAAENYLNSREWAGVGSEWERDVRNVVATKGRPPRLY